ncbi:hypothetical protein [Planotetraspora sp. GP83]|uniref:hypothetical protein n=1 Tax=Planotetraspora sp. GP83 TaxID=3156264 RepID=UPI003519299B
MNNNKGAQPRQTAPTGGARPGRPAVRVRAGLSAAAGLVVILSSGLYGTAQAEVSGQAGQPSASDLATSQWSTRIVAPGVEVRTGTVTHAGAAPVWTIGVQAPATSRLTGAATWADVSSPTWADTTARDLRAKGFEPRVETVRWPDYADTPHGDMGRQVRIGSCAAV